MCGVQFTGHLKVIQTDLKLRVAIYRYKDETTLLTTPENLILFGDCPIEIEPKGDITPFVDSVADSSRYFVVRSDWTQYIIKPVLLYTTVFICYPSSHFGMGLCCVAVLCRVKDPQSARSVSIGIGFRERETAFDFKSSLNEYVRYVDRMCTANEMSKEQANLQGDDDQVSKDRA